MKFILSILSLSAVAIFFASVRAGDEEETKKMCKSMAVDCQNSTKDATDKDVQDMCDKKEPTTTPGKCLMECMLRQFNCMDEKGAFNGPEFLELLRMALDDNNNNTLKMAQEVVINCQDKKDSKGDKCETAFLVMNCMKDEAEKRGMKGI